VISDEDEIVNDLLSRWWSWAKDDRTARGFPSESAFARQYCASRQYDDENLALHSDLEDRFMRAIDATVDAIAQPFRTALAINARNIATGMAVWASARLPSDELARAFLVHDARALLVKRLREQGLL